MLKLEIIADEQDDYRPLRALHDSAELMRRSLDTRGAATAAKWEKIIHDALELALKGAPGKQPIGNLLVALIGSGALLSNALYDLIDTVLT